MAFSMSVSAGKHNARHNTDLEYRAKLDNVDPNLSHLNVVLVDEAIESAYDRLFGAAVEQYNEAQKTKGHPERCIDNYYAKIESAWKADQAKITSGKKGKSNVPQVCYEYVIQIGNRDTWKQIPAETLTEIYKDTFTGIKAKTKGAMDWFHGAIHFDEPGGSAHMHIAGITYGTRNKRGLETQVSMNQALKTLGLKRLPDLQNLLMKELELAAQKYGIERDVMNCDREHQDVSEWKQTQRDTADMTERLERQKERLRVVESELKEASKQRGEIQAQIAAESARLERLRQGTRDLSEEVDAMAVTAASIEHLENAPRREYGAICREITASCNSYTTKINRGIDRLRERINTVKERIQAITQKIMQNFSLDSRAREARKASRGILHQSRSYGRDVGLDR